MIATFLRPGDVIGLISGPMRIESIEYAHGLVLVGGSDLKTGKKIKGCLDSGMDVRLHNKRYKRHLEEQTQTEPYLGNHQSDECPSELDRHSPRLRDTILQDRLLASHLQEDKSWSTCRILLQVSCRSCISSPSCNCILRVPESPHQSCSRGTSKQSFDCKCVDSNSCGDSTALTYAEPLDAVGVELPDFSEVAE